MKALEDWLLQPGRSATICRAKLNGAAKWFIRLTEVIRWNLSAKDWPLDQHTTPADKIVYADDLEAGILEAIRK
jgi:hypothetical protein